MANYISSCRTNYFKVKDREAFIEAMETVPDIKIEEKDDTFVILGDNADGAGFPGYKYNSDDVLEEDFDLALAVSEHLCEDSVAVFMEVGAEKLRYIVGYAEAINHKGEREIINLDEIYERATHLGKDITQAQY